MEKQEEQREVVMTDHSEKRGRKRLGLRKESTQENAQQALDEGITHSETKGRLKKFVDALYLRHGNANNIRIYQQKAYLFRGEVLITIINLPKRFERTAAKIQKRKQEQQKK